MFKKYLFFYLIFLLLSSCGKYEQFFSSKTSLSSKSNKQEALRVYLSDSQEFVDVQSLNRGKRALTFSDKIVFSAGSSFEDNKVEDFTLSLFPLDSLKDENLKKDIKLKLSSFCSQSSENLPSQTTQKEQDAFVDLASFSSYPYLSFADIIPYDFLTNNTGDSFYCTFVVFLNNKTYSLINQKIQPSFSYNSEEFYGLRLAQQTAVGYREIDHNVLTKRDIKTLQLFNETQQEVEKYDLFCGGELALSISKSDQNPVFMNWQSFQKVPKGVEKCRFFSKSHQKITGVSPVFQIDFNGFSQKTELINLNKIKTPEIKPRSYAGTAGYLSFSGLGELNHDYSSIDLVARSQCINVTAFFIKEVLVKETTIPLTKQVPIMSFVPEGLFYLLSTYQDYKIYRENLLLDSIEEIRGIFMKRADREKLSESEEQYFQEFVAGFYGKDSKSIINSLNSSHYRKSKAIPNAFRIFQDTILDYKKELVEYGMQGGEVIDSIPCIFKFTLQDRENPSNTIEFKDLFYELEFNRREENSSYGVNPVFLGSSQEKFLFNDVHLSWLQKSTLKALNLKEKEQFKTKMYSRFFSFSHFYRDQSKDILFQPNYFDKDTSQTEKDGIREVALKCYAEKIDKEYPNEFNIANFKYLEAAMPFDMFPNHSVSLKALASSSSKLKDFLDDTDLMVCRVLFYSKYKDEAILRYFSPEIRFKN